MVSPLVNCEWLKQQLEEKTPNIRILDGHWNPPFLKKDAKQDYLDRHIEGAVRFDIATVADPGSSIPITLPTTDQFQQHVQKMGINNETHVVIYDNQPKFGFYSGGRVWWMFKTFGHTNVSILDGGLPKWLANGYPTASGPEPVYTPTTYTPTFHPELVRYYDGMLKNFETKTEQVVDARPQGMFDGTAPDPNPKLHSGHILGAKNLPFFELVDKDTKTLLSKEELRKLFERHEVDVDKPLVVMCGGAVVSPLIAFSAYLVTGNLCPVYDGSWSEWASKAPPETMKIGVKGEDLK